MEISSPVLLNLNSIQREVDVDESLRKLSETIVSFGQAERGFCVKKGVLLFKSKIVLPCNSALKNRFLEEYDFSPLDGHSGAEKTHKRLAANLYWTGMNGDVKKYWRLVQFVSRINQKILAPPGYSNFYSFRQVWEDISMDLSKGYQSPTASV